MPAPLKRVLRPVPLSEIHQGLEELRDRPQGLMRVGSVTGATQVALPRLENYLDRRQPGENVATLRDRYAHATKVRWPVKVRTNQAGATVYGRKSFRSGGKLMIEPYESGIKPTLHAATTTKKAA